MSTSSASGRNPRRRDPALHRAILDATVRLLERDGYGKLTIEGIAAEAGVGKQTIYRWWRGKPELVMEAYIAAGEERVPAPDTGDVTADLEAILVPVFALNADYASGGALANKGMVAESQLDPAFHEIYASLHRAWWGPLVAVIERAQARGQLRADVAPQDLVDIMLGASWYRVLLEHAPLDADFARLIVRSLVESNRPLEWAEMIPRKLGTAAVQNESNT
jgi:AcrR family transcriptional regulator